MLAYSKFVGLTPRPRVTIEPLAQCAAPKQNMIVCHGRSFCKGRAGCSKITDPPQRATGMQSQNSLSSKQLPTDSCEVPAASGQVLPSIPVVPLSGRGPLMGLPFSSSCCSKRALDQVSQGGPRSIARIFPLLAAVRRKFHSCSECTFMSPRRWLCQLTARKWMNLTKMCSSPIGAAYGHESRCRPADPHIGARHSKDPAQGLELVEDEPSCDIHVRINGVGSCLSHIATG